MFQLGCLSGARRPARFWAPCPIFERPARSLGVFLRPAQIFSPVYTSHWFLDSKRPCGFEERIVDWYRACDVRFAQTYSGTPRVNDMRRARAEQSYSYACVRTYCHAVEETKTGRAGKGRKGRLAAIGIFQTSVR